MIEARIDIRAENYYSCEITRTLPVRISLVAINGPVGFGIIEALDGKEVTLKEYVKKMRASSSILDFKITHQEASLYWTRAEHEMMKKSIHETILESGSMNRLPIIIEKGIQRHVILAPSQEAFRKTIDALKKRFDEVRIRKVTNMPGATISTGLTEKQSTAFKLAYEAGYYDIPRRITIENLSERMDIKRVALQERLRRVERKIFRDFYDSFF